MYFFRKVNWSQSNSKANLGNVSTTCGEINCDDDICTVKVYWQDKRGLSGSDEEGITNELVEITSRL